MKKKLKHVHSKQGAKKQFAPAKNSFQDFGKYYIFLAIIILISFFIYLPIFNNGFLAWDDNSYIKNNPLVISFDVSKIFSSNVMGNYHPVTILVLAIEYHLFGLNAVGFHAVNLSLHLLNVLLVFQTINLLSNKPEVALVAALLFGVHPLHVESVAWAAELKDLLYTFFFLLSYIFYLKYIDASKRKYLIIALLLFIVSLLSKAMAASLPVVFLLTDYFKGRKINSRTLLEKIPFFLIAFILGFVAVQAQQESGTTQIVEAYGFMQRIVFAGYGFILYLIKLILPIHLSAFYPYPVKPGVEMPAQYYLYLFICICILAAIIFSTRYSRKIVYGIGFFAITIFLVLQLFPVGSAVIADRYSYIPSIGVFYLVGEGVNYLWEKRYKYLVILSLGIVSVFYSVTTYNRSAIWKTDLTLWNDVIEKYQTIATAYVGRANYLRDEKKYDEALKDYNKAVELNPGYFNSYFNRGTLYLFQKRNDEALIDINKTLELKPDFYKAHYNRGVVYANKSLFDEAIKNYSKAIELQPNYAEAYYSKGLAELSLNKKNEGCVDLKQSLNLGYKPAAEKIEKYCN